MYSPMMLDKVKKEPLSQHPTQLVLKIDPSGITDDSFSAQNVVIEHSATATSADPSSAEVLDLPKSEEPDFGDLEDCLASPPEAVDLKHDVGNIRKDDESSTLLKFIQDLKTNGGLCKEMSDRLIKAEARKQGPWCGCTLEVIEKKIADGDIKDFNGVLEYLQLLASAYINTTRNPKHPVDQVKIFHDIVKDAMMFQKLIDEASL